MHIIKLLRTFVGLFAGLLFILSPLTAAHSQETSEQDDGSLEYAYRAYEAAAAANDREEAQRLAVMAWQRGEEDESLPIESLVILAQNAALESIFIDPAQALAPAERSLALAEEGIGTSSLNIDEQRVLVGAAAYLSDREDDAKRIAVIEALTSYWQEQSALTRLLILASVEVGTSALESDEPGEALAALDPFANALEASDIVVTDVLVRTNMLRVAARIMSDDQRITYRRTTLGVSSQRIKFRGEEEKVQNLREAIVIASRTLDLFDPVKTVDEISLDAATLVAWRRAATAILRTLETETPGDYEFEGRRFDADRRSLLTDPGLDCDITWKRRQQPDYPRRARSRITNGALFIGYDLTPEGRVTNARILAEVPTNTFAQPTLDAMERWRADVDGLPAACLTDRPLIMTFQMQL